VTDYPANYTGFTGANADEGDFCLLAFGVECQTQSFNPLEDDRTSPFRTGYRQKYGVSASGGSELATYYIAGDFEDSNGLYEFDLNTLERINLRANIRGQLNDNFDLTVNTGYVNSEIALPQNDNNILGILSGALLGLDTQFDSTTLGFLAVTPEQLESLRTDNVIERIIGSATANWRPISWLSVVATAGLDRLNQFDNQTVLPNKVFFGSLPEGQRFSSRAQISNYTANLNGTASYTLRDNLTGNTSVGVQYNEDIFRLTSGFGARLLPGTSSLDGTTARFSVDEDNNQTRLLGGYVQQQFGLNDRIFVTGSVRGDDNSAFGQDFGVVYYPSVNASWVISEEPWFIPNQTVLSNLRLRAAYGTSGLRPGQLDALQFLNPTAVTENGQSVPGFTFGGTGNPNLRPEKSREVEVGFDAGFFNERLGLELTYYNKTSEDALISRRLPPSLGVSTTRFENLGEVLNRGLELLVNANIVERPNFKWDATITGALLRNELVDIGTDPATGQPIPPIIGGLGLNSQRTANGLPIGSYFGTPFDFSDADGNGLITPDEIELADSATFLGNPFPEQEASFQTNATFFNVVKLSGLLDYRGSYQNFNSTEEFRCGAFFNCRALYDPSTSLEDQANAVASAFFGSHAGYIEDADFVKLRELSVTLMAPESFARSFRSQALSLTLAGRNLATWTDYSGLDPEINFAGSGSNFTTAEFLTQPPARFFTARLDVTF
jgi:outer membrane receptor protein involved in Fe transport